MPIFVAYNENKLYNTLFLNKVTNIKKFQSVTIEIDNIDTNDLVNFHKFSCAGFLLYSDKYVILGFNKWRKVYEDFSGRKDITHDTIEQVAISELFEESSGTILMKDISDVPYLNVPIINKRRIMNYCRLYLLKIPNNSVDKFIDIFKENRKLMKNKKYKEMSKIVKVSKEKFIDALKKNKNIYDYPLNHRLKYSLLVQLEKLIL
jgi:hypothetical protein